MERGFVCSPEDLLSRSEVAGHGPQSRTACVPLCGDGLVVGEACDDGGRVPGDGCDELCQVEPGYSCGSAGASRNAVGWWWFWSILGAFRAEEALFAGVSSPSVCGPICGAPQTSI